MRVLIFSMWVGLLTGVLCAGPRDAEWSQVEEARAKDQPKTEIKLLSGIEKAALADGSWAEASRAMAQRIATEEKIEGNAAVLNKFDIELKTAPEKARPILRTMAAGWLFGYYLENSWEIMGRSSMGGGSGRNLDTWDLARIHLEIDQRMQLALKDEEILKTIPVTEFGELLSGANLGDQFHPTMFDFVAQQALEFYLNAEEISTFSSEGAFEIRFDSPALESVDKFLAWTPETTEVNSPKLRALEIYQKLLMFHRNDTDQNAFIMADLDRLRWAKFKGVGEDKIAWIEKALRRFIAQNVTSPVSAWARMDLGELLFREERNKEAHQVLIEGSEAFPDHPFGKLCRNGVTQLEERELELSTESHWTPAGEEIQVSYRNLKRVYFRIYPVPFSPGSIPSPHSMLPPLGSDTLKPEPKNWLAELLKKEPAKTWESALADRGDYSQQSQLLEAPRDLPDGFYVLLASADREFSEDDNEIAVTEINVTPLAMVVSETAEGGIEGLVMDAVTGAPLAGIEVRVEFSKKKQRKSFNAQTDHQGYFRIENNQAGSYLIVAQRGQQRAVVQSWFRKSDQNQERDKNRTIFFTDRAIYRPGQTVHFKGIWFQYNHSEAKYQYQEEAKGTVHFQDPSGQKISSLKIITNQRGSFSGSFTAPPGGLLGKHTVHLDQAEGRANLRVEEYKRPKFFTKIDPPKEPVILGQKVSIKVRAESYTGAPIDGAAVKWSITRTPQLPDWTQWCWWIKHRWPETTGIAHGTSETRPDGTVLISFLAKPDRSVSEDFEPVFHFEITADVTDGAGETRSAVRTVQVSKTSLKALLLADDWLESGKDQEFRIRTESLDGEGRSAKGVLKIHRLKEPETCPRPLVNIDRYRSIPENDFKRPSPDPDRWKPGEFVKEIPIETNRDGNALAKTELEAGAYRLIFETQDASGRKVQALRGIQIVAPEADNFPTKRPFHVDAPSWSAEPGEDFLILWGSGHAEASACIEWYRQEQLLRREWSKPGRTQQVFSLPIEETHRGGISIVVRQVTMNRLHQLHRVIEVPWTNKKLKLRWEHLVSKLDPGEKETWTAIIEDAEGEAAVAEMVATMYDASLDVFVPLYFHSLMGGLRKEHPYEASSCFSSEENRLNQQTRFERPRYLKIDLDFRRFRPELEEYGGLSAHLKRSRAAMFGVLPEVSGGDQLDLFSPSDSAVDDRRSLTIANGPLSSGMVVSLGMADDSTFDETGNWGSDLDGDEHPNLNQILARKNLQETAFFYPTLISDADGKVRVSFTMPEALTTWRFLGMANDEKFRSGLLEGETVTSKDLMVQPNPPRFLREGDALEFTVKVTNQSEKEQSGTARLSLADAATDKDRTAAMGITAPDQKFTVPAKESRTLKWKIAVPDGAGFLKYKAVAATGDLTDGEEGWLPVISRRILVTESMSLPIRNAGSKKFEFTKLLESGDSETLEDRFLHVQVVSQPAWYAVMALPYLMEFPHECSEQTFNRYYANALAKHIAGSDPKMRRIFDQWKAGGDTLDSPLMKNADLKGILLDETPWLREATSEAEARRRLGLLFDDNHMDRELEKALRKLSKMQRGDGLWPWFPGGRGSEYISLYVTTGFARLRSLGVETDITPAMKSLPPLDAALIRRYEDLRKDKRLEENNLSPWAAHHLYTRTFFLKDKKLSQGDKVAFDYFVGQAKKHWAGLTSRMSRAHVALALHRLGEKEVPKLVTRSLKENAKVTEEQGMFWKDSEGEGWWWWQAPIETQAMMIEAFREVDQDAKAVDDCQVWLIKQKQVGDWKTTKATADAVYSLLMGGRNLLGSDALLKISLGGEEVKPQKVEAGTGFYESRFVEAAVKPELGKIELTKSDEGVSWASVHWQYLEDMAKVTKAEGEQLELEKKLFVRKNTDKGPVLMPLNGAVNVGDELVTRVILRNDRAMEFVHLKDLRGSGTEPTNVLSGYRWQDGFGYYEVTRDTASHFFIDRLPPGVHVFETSVRVQHAGEYQTGIAEVRCMYAPEFASHSESVGIQAE